MNTVKTLHIKPKLSTTLNLQILKIKQLHIVQSGKGCIHCYSTCDYSQMLRHYGTRGLGLHLRLVRYLGY